MESWTCGSYVSNSRVNKRPRARSARGEQKKLGRHFLQHGCKAGPKLFSGLFLPQGFQSKLLSEA